MSRSLSGLAAAALLTLAACGGGMGKADLRVTDTKVVDCPDGTCVAATCVVTNVGIADIRLDPGPTGERNGIPVVPVSETLTAQATISNSGTVPVDTIIVKEMGSNPYKALQKYNIKLLYAGDERIEVADIVKQYEAGKLQPLNDMQMQTIINKHERHHTHDDGHSHTH